MKNLLLLNLELIQKKKTLSHNKKKKIFKNQQKRNPIIKPQPEFNFEESMKTLVVK